MFTLGRSIDIHYPTNRLILVIAAITGMIGIFTSGDWLIGLKIGGSIFLTWAMGRELDPRREYGAFVAVALALYSLFVPFEVEFMEIFFFMLALRLISTTCGKPPTWFDALTVLGVAGYLSYSSENPIYLLTAIIGVFISGALSKIEILHRILSLVAGGSIGYVLSMFFVDTTFDTPILSFPFLLIITLIYSIFAYLDRNNDKNIYDDQNNQISPTKILKSQLFFAISFILLALFSNLAIGNMILYVSAMVGLTLYGIASRIAKIED